MSFEREQARGEILGLATRRLKWHVAEHNRILAEWSLIPGGQRRQAARALVQHRAGAAEAIAFSQFLEPSWGEERETTEGYIHWEGAPAPSQESPGSEYDAERTLAKAMDDGFPSEPE